jgi:uncharacterized membrane-anchored protein
MDTQLEGSPPLAEVSLTVRPDSRRAFVMDELHARPFPKVEPGRQLLMLAIPTGPQAAGNVQQQLRQMLPNAFAAVPDQARHAVVNIPEADWLRVERHSEFVTVTLSRPLERLREAVAVFETLAKDHAALAAIDMRLLGRTEPPVMGPGTCIATSQDGRLSALTTFRAEPTGYTRIDVTGEAQGVMLAEFVQQALEIEVYRSFALLGLDHVRQRATSWSAIETDVARLTGALQQGLDDGRNRAFLGELTELAAKVEREVAEASFRFAATRAYGALVKDRLNALEGDRAGHPGTWSAFLDRRLTPALRTCEASAGRRAEVLTQINRLSDLLRTSVDIALQEQSHNQLEVMNKRVQLQLRLQQTVEGLSVAALSYYVLGLLGYLFKGVRSAGYAVDTDVATAIAVPIVVPVIWWIVRRVRGRHDDND